MLQVPFIVDDLYSLDPEFVAALQPLHALIFLFKWIPSANETAARAGEDDPDFHGFFAHQVVNNACATLAVGLISCTLTSLHVTSSGHQCVRQRSRPFSWISTFRIVGLRDELGS
jgi:hypothetical protein